MASSRQQMPAPTRDERYAAEAFVQAVVGAWSWRISVAHLLTRASLFTAITLAVALVIVIFDHLLPGGLPRLLIAGAGLLLVAAATGALLSLLIRAVRGKVNPAFAARAAEQSREIPHNLLLSAVVLSDNTSVAYARPAAVAQAAAALDTTHEKPGGLMSWRGLALPAAAALAWVLYALIAAKPVLPSLLRMFGWDLAAPTATRIERVLPAPGAAVYVGRPLELEFRLTGRAAAEFTFEQFNDDGSVRQRRSLAPAAGEGSRRRVSLSAQEVSGTLRYRCRAGDGVLEEALRTVETPRVVQTSVELTPPEYTGEPARTVVDGDITAWLGTRARFSIQAASEIREALLVVQGREETRTRMEIAADNPLRAGVSLNLSESGDYWISLSDTHGTPADTPLRRRINVRIDAAPTVRITEPEAPRGAPLDVSKVARLAAVANDDVRLAGVWFVQEQAGQTQRVELTRGGAALATTEETGFPLARLNLNVGQSARVWFEAGDSRHLPDGTPAPQTGASPVLTVIRSSRDIAKDDVPEPGKTGSTPGGKDGASNGERGTANAAGGSTPGKAGSGTPGTGPTGSGAPSASGESTESGAGGSGTSGGAAGEGDGEAQPGGEGGVGDFESKLRDFVARHGADARKIREGEDGGQSGGGEGGSGESSGATGAAGERRDARPQPEDEGAPSQPRSQPDSTNTEPGKSQPPDKPEPPGDEETKGPESQPATQPAEKAGEDEAKPEGARPPSLGADSQPTSKRSDSEPKSPDEKQDSEAPEKQRDPSATAQSQPSDDTKRDNVQPDPTVKHENDERGAPDRPAVVEMPPDPPVPEPVANNGEGSYEGEMRGSPALERRGERVDVLDMLARGGPPREEDLVALGWPEARRREFLRDFERLRASARKAGVVGPAGEWHGQALYGTDEVARGAARSTPVGETVYRGTSLSDGLNQIAQPRESAVPVSLKPVLEAYYRALAKRRGASSQPVRD